jgi:hypothetical protein
MKEWEGKIRKDEGGNNDTRRTQASPIDGGDFTI